MRCGVLTDSQRNGDLESRRREQGEKFLEIQQQRYKVLLEWRQHHYARAKFEEEKERCGACAVLALCLASEGSGGGGE